MAQPLQKKATEILTKTDYERVSPLESELTLFKRQTDPRFGDIQILQHNKSRNFFAAKEHVVNDLNAAAELIAIAKKRLMQQHPHILSVVDYSSAKKSQLCSTNYVIKFFYEYPHSDFLKESTERQKTGVSFSHEELVHYLYQQLLALSHLEYIGRFHGDVRPVHVTISKTELLSKLIDKSDLITSAEKAKQAQAQHVIAKDSLYQSPALFENLKKNNLKFELNQNKEDLFALGLVFLEVGNQAPIQNVYASPKGVFDADALQAHLNAFKNHYVAQSPLLTSVVTELLVLNQENRPVASELLHRMPDYKTVIRAIQERGTDTSNALSYSIINQPRGFAEKPNVTVNTTLPSDDQNPVKQEPQYTTQWVPHVDHKYIRLDKSVERPRVIPYKDENSKVLVHTAPFPEDTTVRVQNPPRQFVVTKSIENPDRVLYLAPTADQEGTQHYLNNNYKNYLATQNEVVVERIHHKYIGPGQFQVEKSVEVINKDGTITQVANNEAKPADVREKSPSNVQLPAKVSTPEPLAKLSNPPPPVKVSGPAPPSPRVSNPATPPRLSNVEPAPKLSQPPPVSPRVSNVEPAPKVSQPPPVSPRVSNVEPAPKVSQPPLVSPRPSNAEPIPRGSNLEQPPKTSNPVISPRVSNAEPLPRPSNPALSPRISNAEPPERNSVIHNEPVAKNSLSEPAEQRRSTSPNVRHDSSLTAGHKEEPHKRESSVGGKKPSTAELQDEPKRESLGGLFD